MNDIRLAEMVERYLDGALSNEEKILFEELRKTRPEVDQEVVEHRFFMNQMERYEQDKQFRSSIDEVHSRLMEEGKIGREPGSSKVFYLWNRYRRTIAVAASIAGITALIISGMISSLTPKTDKAKIEYLGRKIDILERDQNHTRRELSDVKNKIEIPGVPAKFGGTGFLIDAKGYLVTNAHVVNKAARVTVQSKSGVELNADIVYSDDSMDIAILKISDSLYKPLTGLPYYINNKTTTDLAEAIFTLGYPRDEIVYGEGYLSAKTGYNGDTLTCQISISANPGNSGGPVINKDGEVIGILSTRETSADGVVFAIKSKSIFKAVEALKKENSNRQIKLPSASLLKHMERTQQVKKIENCVFMVKGY
ncbi:MAG: serine protease [Chitinophagaceae bacterium]|nr:serine protease [Chitinophagaceae bacterium]